MHRGKVLDAQRRDRIAGVLVGTAAGDALGAGFEFTTPPVGAAIEMVGGGPFGWAPGEWTDDTSMAVCIARVTAEGMVDPARIGRAFLDWYATLPRDVGLQTRDVLGRAEGAPEHLAAIAAARYEEQPDRSAGNGSLMRTAPIALACLGDDEALAGCAREVSALTHADPLCGDACVLWCVAIDRAVREERLDGIADGLDLLPAARRDRWAAALAEVDEQPAASFTRNGYVVRALQAALAAVRQTPVPDDDPQAHLAEALRAAVRIGDDTDTVAAIAGGLLGGRWGASAVPGTWRELLHGWPGIGADELADLAWRTAEPAG
jgi:ADP-ribosyl-[dinitrogen reductase] hydrolase